MAQPKLSNAQIEVLKWLGHGWKGQPSTGFAITVNGQRICNIDTMTALESLGYVE